MSTDLRESQDGLNQFGDFVGNRDMVLPLTETEMLAVKLQKKEASLNKLTFRCQEETYR